MSINPADTVWILISSALVMLMTPGVALFYGGMVRRKNLLSTMMMSFACLGLVGLLWVLYGYSLSFGSDQAGIIGGLNFIGLMNVGQEPSPVYATTVPHLGFMMFQAMFAIITVALITGAVVERIKFSALLIFSALWMTLVYSPVAHWVWGSGGWLARLGVLDFAGGSVVHLNAGVSALALVLLLGRRRGFPEDAMEPNNIPLVVLGAGLLWFGWFGFNAGSALTCRRPGRQRLCHHQYRGGRRRFYLDGYQLDLPPPDDSRHGYRGCGRPGHHNSGRRLCDPPGGHPDRHRGGYCLLLCYAAFQDETRLR